MTDAATGQQYLRARYYDPGTGRFNRLDPFEGTSNDPQSLHKYAYVHGEPIHGTDPTGLYNFVRSIEVAAFNVQVFALEAAPTVAAYGYGIAKISGFAFLISSGARLLEAEGWIPESGITEPVQ